MINEKIEFYYSRSKLYSGFALTLLLGFFGVSIMIYANRSGDLFFGLIGFLNAVTFFVLAISNILKLSRDYPYIRITDEYIQIDSFTRSEITIYLEEIEHIRAGELQLQPLIEIEVYDQDKFFKNLSFHNKFRLFMNTFQAVSIITITTRVLEKEEQTRLIDALNLAIEEIRGIEGGPSIPYIVTEQNKDQFEPGDLVQEYEFKPKIDRSMDGQYLAESYKSSFKFFKISFIAIYWLFALGGGYLLYILASLFLYPLAKMPFDYWIGFRMKHMYSDPRMLGSRNHKISSFILGLLLFQSSVFVAPVGLIFLLARKKSSESDSINLPIKSAFKKIKKEKLAMGRKERNKSILMLILGIAAVFFKPMDILDPFEKYPIWFFTLLPLRVLISQIIAIVRIKIYEKKKKLLLFVNFSIGTIFLLLFLLILLSNPGDDLSIYALFLLIAMTNFLNPFTSGLTEKGVYYRHFNIRNFFGYKPVFYEYKELSSLDFEMGGKEIKLLIHANILKPRSKKALVFSLKDMTAINRMINEFN